MALKVLCLRADYGGCSKYRLVEPIEELKRQGFDVDIRIDVDLAVDAEKIIYGNNRHEYEIFEIQEDIDLLVLQRPLNKSIYEVAKQAKKQGIALVVELDDDLDTVHPDNGAYRSVHPKYSPDSNYEWVWKVCGLADLVTVSTPRLTRWGAEVGVEAVVLRNCIPDDIFDTPPDASFATSAGLGWSGTVSTHPTDLLQVDDAVARVLRKTGKDFHVVGDGNGVSFQLGLDPGNKIHTTGWVDLELYMDTLKKNIRVGIVPLEISPFNEAKSNLKGLEMASLGIPFVASPTSEYKFLAEYGVGQIATTPAEWYKMLSRLLTDDRKAYMMGQKYRRIVGENFRYSQHAHKWFTAWDKAVQNSKSKRNVLV